MLKTGYQVNIIDASINSFALNHKHQTSKLKHKTKELYINTVINLLALKRLLNKNIKSQASNI